uniref:Integrase catalytic domain-containing protein n=1 Tax=Tanacetum cinerariifolium TaxID=118510 RepID=A0A6L2LF77_TANCI|nr:hypothetical protein [Tanacetum cinerariifolium]
MKNTNTNLQTHTSNALHNAIMEAGDKDPSLMLAPGNYVQWRSKIKRYIDTKPNNELIHYCLQNLPYKFKWSKMNVPVAEGIDNDIYSAVDACTNAYDAENSGPIFDVEPLQKVQNNDDIYNVFANEREHPEQPKYVIDTYPDEHNRIIYSWDMSHDIEQDDQDNNDDLAKERDLLAFLIEKLKCEIDDRLIPTTSVNRPQLKSNKLEDRVLHNNSQGKIPEVEDHRMNFKFSNNKNYVTACNDSLNAKTSNVNFVCVTCGKCLLNDNHDMCVLHYIYGLNTGTKQPIVVPISTREPKRTMNQSVATPLKRTVASESINQKPKSIIRKQYEQISKTSRRYNSIHRRLWELKAHDGKSQASIILWRNFWGNDLLIGSRGTDLYFITLQDTFTPNPIFLMAKATSSQAWLWHRKAKQKPFHTKTTLSSKRRLLILHLDLCGPMSVESFNGKKYMLVTIDDYSRYTWAHFLRSKDETPQVLIDFFKLVRRGLHAQVRTIQTDKGTKFSNKTVHEYFAQEGIEHQTSVSQTPKQNGAEAIAITCFIQNRSLVIPRHEKTPYHIISGRKPSVKFFHIFSSLCYIVRDGENLDKMKEKGHLLEQVIRNPSQSIRTRRQLETDGEMCMFTLTVSQMEPKNIKEAMADSVWIEAMQEQFHQFDQLDVWELVDRPLYKNATNLNWLWKNKRDEENIVLRNKARLVAKGYNQ